MLPLDDKWSVYLQSQPETGMGYQVVGITTTDGKVYPQVIVESGFVTRVRGYDEIPFSAEQICGIKVNHEKWEWAEDRRSR
jgi:hypothetical protein